MSNTNHTYEDKLREVGLLSLVQRRQRGDMIQTWKILIGYDRVDRNSMFTLATDIASRSTRQSTDPLYIVKPLAKLDQLTFFQYLYLVGFLSAYPMYMTF